MAKKINKSKNQIKKEIAFIEQELLSLNSSYKTGDLEMELYKLYKALYAKEKKGNKTKKGKNK